MTRGAALEALVDDAAGDLLAYLVRRTSRPEDAADLLGDVFAALAAHPERIPVEPEQARMWAFGIARNALRGHYRRTARADAVTARLRERIRTAVTTHPGDDREAIRDEVRLAVRSLPQRQRELVALVHWDGFSIEQAAAHLGMHPSTARTHLLRARRRLRTLLAPALDPEPAVPCTGGALHRRCPAPSARTRAERGAT